MLGLGNFSSKPDIARWDPENGLSLTIWLTAREADLTLVSTAITTWTDRVSGLAYTQSTAARKPVWNSSDQTITFTISGTADYLQEASTPVVLDTSATGYTLAWYGTSTDWNSGADQVFFGDAGANNDFFFLDADTNDLALKADGQTRTFSLDNPGTLTNDTLYHIMVVVQTNGAAILYIDNVAQEDTETFTNTKDFEIDQISGKNSASKTFDGKYKEIMVFRSPLSASDRKGCYEYMTRPSYT